MATSVEEQVHDGMTAIRISRRERQVLRHALNTYEDALEKASKKMRELGLPTDDTTETLAIINGGDGFGKGLYSVLSEQMSIGDQAQQTLDDEKRAMEAEVIATRDAVLALSDMPHGSYAEELRRFVRTWPSERLQAVRKYCMAVGALAEGEAYTGEVPPEVGRAIDRGIEWTMSADELAHFLQHGPWETAEEKPDNDGVILWHAQRENVPLGGDVIGTEIHPDRFDTEDAAKRCVARLNRLWHIEHGPATDTTDDAK